MAWRTSPGSPTARNTTSSATDLGPDAQGIRFHDRRRQRLPDAGDIGAVDARRRQPCDCLPRGRIRPDETPKTAARDSGKVGTRFRADRAPAVISRQAEAVPRTMAPPTYRVYGRVSHARLDKARTDHKESQPDKLPVRSAPVAAAGGPSSRPPHMLSRNIVPDPDVAHRCNPGRPHGLEVGPCLRSVSTPAG